MSIIGIIVVGMTLTVFITRGMADLSVPATVAVGGILVLALQPAIGSIPAGLVGIAVATVAGLLNGLLIGYAGLNLVITTLATGTIVLGIAQSAVGGVIVYGNDNGIQSFLTGRILGVVPVIVLLFLLDRRTWAPRALTHGMGTVDVCRRFEPSCDARERRARAPDARGRVHPHGIARRAERSAPRTAPSRPRAQVSAWVMSSTRSRLWSSEASACSVASAASLARSAGCRCSWSCSVTSWCFRECRPSHRA